MNMLLSQEFSVSVVAPLHNGCIGALEQSLIKSSKLLVYKDVKLTKWLGVCLSKLVL